MSEIFENVKSFIEQEVELFGDGFAFERAVVQNEEPSEKECVAENWKQSTILDDFNNIINNCAKCSLAQQRQQFVFGEGNKNADILLVGEAPGADEDRVGRPIVGAAGILLDKILAAINLTRSEVYICNILKCHPPKDREPLPEEIAMCQPYLAKQIELIKPKFILCLGRFAAQTLLQTKKSHSSLRGQFYDYGQAQLLVTYHPAALLQHPENKRATWEDVQLLQKNYLLDKNNNH